MKHAALVVFIPIWLSGCQTPIVAVRNLTLDSKFTVDGKHYDLKTNFSCHLEDLTWISERGADWHIREGAAAVRITGKLDNGNLFEVLPSAPNWHSGFCPENTEAINATLFIESDNGQVESFDKTRNASSIHNMQFLDAKLSPAGSGLDTFVDHNHWPTAVVETKRYYTVRATIYEASRWKDRPEVAKFIKDRKVLWLERGKTYSFSTWSDSDVAFARLRQSDNNIDGYTDSAARYILVPDGDSWVFSDSEHSSVQWRLEPQPSNQAEKREIVPSPKFKRWLVYKGTRIELPLRSYYRLFYEPEYDQLIEFRAEHVDLW